MNYRRKVDASQEGIVAALRAVGAEVEVMSYVGHGVPDLHVQHKDRLYWLECKNPGPPSAKKLTAAELAFAMRFPVHVVSTPQEALAAIGVNLAA